MDTAKTVFNEYRVKLRNRALKIMFIIIHFDILPS